MDDRLRRLLAGYVDGELTGEERKEFELALEQNEELRYELEEFRNLKETTNQMHYADLPKEVWDSYWASIYRKTERGIGWILFSSGAIILLLFGMYEMFKGMYADPDAPLWLKIGVTAGTAGAIFLLVSYLRERLFAFKRERYREVER